MKAVIGGMLGALLMILAFLAGLHWHDLTKIQSDEFVRYEMHVGSDGTVTRLDRVNGTIHMITANGASDVPEHFVAPGATPVKP